MRFTHLLLSLGLGVTHTYIVCLFNTKTAYRHPHPHAVLAARLCPRQKITSSHYNQIIAFLICCFKELLLILRIFLRVSLIIVEFWCPLHSRPLNTCMCETDVIYPSCYLISVRRSKVNKLTTTYTSMQTHSQSGT